jgi:hypothetical protein
MQIVQYNARFYTAAPFACVLLGVLSRNTRLPKSVKVLVSFALAITSWWTLASLLVSHLVYDRSTLMQWRWIEDVLPKIPRRWANLHCGLDESSATLHALFPETEGVTLDFFDADVMQEPSIQIARRCEAAKEEAVAATPVNLRALQYEAGCFDTIFLFFSAHEIRDAELRLQFFKELHRVLCVGGQVLLVEHPRDAANFLAFGPGFFHFWPHSEWRRLAHESRFNIAREFSITPFVRVWLLEKR